MQTSDVIATQLPRAALNNSESGVVRDGDRDGVAAISASLRRRSFGYQSTAVKNWTLTSRNVATNSALTSRQKSRSNIYVYTLCLKKLDRYD